MTKIVLFRKGKCKQIPSIFSPLETHLKYKYRSIKSKRMGKEDHPNTNQKQSGMTMSISDKINFITGKFTSDKKSFPKEIYEA